ncbi:transporter of the permease [Corynebacterium kutscheri]|uniref:AI-2E family transporter n=1 Tax=Corynebacterium kutscheri TaxID=35755 RepID=UPI000F6B4504|nr:transporter of the permease [Corynebacterium kutscheri]
MISATPEPNNSTSPTAKQLTTAMSPAEIYSEMEPIDRPIDRSHIIAAGIKSLAAWCLRLLIISAAIYVGWLIIKQMSRGVLPVALALIVCTVLWPIVSWLRAQRVPAGLASLIAILITFGCFGGLIWLIAPNVGRQSQTLYYQTFEGVQRLQLWLQGPPFNLADEQINQRINEAARWVQNQSGNIAGEIFSGLGIATSILVTIGIVLVLTFFFLKDGDRFLPWLRSITGQRVGWHLTEVLTRSWIALSGYIRAQAIVSFLDALLIGAGLVLLGVPMALALTVLTFIAGFIPIVGAFVAGSLAVLVTLVSLGLTKAIITLVIVLAVQQFEGNVLHPVLQSRAINLHPGIILFAVTVGSSLFGIMGAFLAVPVSAIVAVIARYTQEMIAIRAGEKKASEIVFVTQAGSLGGLDGELTGLKMRAAFRAMTSPLHREKSTTAEQSEMTPPRHNNAVAVPKKVVAKLKTETKRVQTKLLQRFKR